MDLHADDVEIDRMDEILCPHDLDFTRQIYVKDDDLRDHKLDSDIHPSPFP